MAEPARLSLPVAQTQRSGLVEQLRRRVRGEVRAGEHDRRLYATDASIYHVEPLAVVVPEDVEDAVAALRLCAQWGAPVLARGGGTSLAGQCVNRAVVVDMSRSCCGVGEVDAKALRAQVEPGVVLDELNAALAQVGLCFAPDVATASHATIGGMIGNNSAGARSILYGHTCDHVEAIDAAVFTQDGGVERVRFTRLGEMDHPLGCAIGERIIELVERNAQRIRQRFPRTPRKVSGYSLDRLLDQLESDGKDAVNLATLLCGSEGTLAVTLGATLTLTRLPAARLLSVAVFGSLEEALMAVAPARRTGPSAVELLDETALSLARASAAHRDDAQALPTLASGAPAQAALLVEHSADSAATALAQAAQLREALAPARVVAVDDADAARLWALRKAVEPLLHAIPGRRKPVTFVEDASAPPERLVEFVSAFRRIVESRGLRAAYFAHASVGVLHIRPMLDLRDERDRDLLRDIAVDVADLARSMGGALSGEHGDGRVRGPLLERYFGREIMALFRQVKALFDPRGLLNPGGIVEPGPVESITQSLRVDTVNEAALQGLRPFFDYSGQGGLLGALEACNGAGFCRRRRGGVMCPSFRATLDERHSTRGRANALRLALTAGPALADPETLQTLDLCLSCKACKGECPSGVDVARLKSEYLAQSRARGALRATRAERWALRMRTGARAASLAPWLAGALLRAPGAERAVKKALGIAPSRRLPAPGRRLPLRDPPRRAGRMRVALFLDCFTGFGEREIALDAVAALEAAGCDVVVRDVGCCQRPALSMGFLDRAARAARRLARRLGTLADEVDAIAALEPSCWSALRDDLPALALDERTRTRLQRVGEKALLFEQVLVDALEKSGRKVEPRPDQRRGLLHLHCHQRALGAGGATQRLLGRLGVAEAVETLETTCCGMAGLFGMLEEREPLSRAIAELDLAPAVRSLAADALVLATGTSCRAQILDVAGRAALHPAQLAARILGQPERTSP